MFDVYRRYNGLMYYYLGPFVPSHGVVCGDAVCLQQDTPRPKPTIDLPNSYKTISQYNQPLFSQKESAFYNFLICCRQEQQTPDPHLRLREGNSLCITLSLNKRKTNVASLYVGKMCTMYHSTSLTSHSRLASTIEGPQILDLTLLVRSVNPHEP